MEERRNIDTCDAAYAVSLRAEGKKPLSINLKSNQRIDYLRLSITDRCNLRCIYCQPVDRNQFFTRNEVLRYEEMARLVNVFVELGVKKVRITGGEPLIKKNVTSLIRMLREIRGLEDISMTTNGVYLKDMAYQLKEAGLDRVNISLDTLRKVKYISITGRDCFEDVWAGIHKALEVGLNPVKLNVVVMKGINDDELLDFVRLTLEYPLIVRFIEFFPTDRLSKELVDYVIRSCEIKEKIVDCFGEMRRDLRIRGNGPAMYYRLKESIGPIGFISGFSSNFCNACNRIRVDCTGRLSPCLFSGYILDFKRVLRSENWRERLPGYIRDVFEMKSLYSKNRMNINKIEMSSIGG